MNRIYKPIWNDAGNLVAASEITRSHGRKSSAGSGAMAGGGRLVLKSMAAALLLAYGSQVCALPTGGNVSAGNATIVASPGNTTINQASQNVAINWQGFSIAAGEAVQFVQPNSSSVALNRVLGSDPSSILGSLSANGKVFLINPNGILFGQGAQVNVAGLVASTLNITDNDFMAGRYQFSGAGPGSIINQGSINADGGYVALLGAKISNEGVISARLGTVAMAAGNAVTLDVAGDGLLNVIVNEGAVNTLVENGGLIRADGGHVLLTAMAAGNLLQSAVNNTGIIQAQTIDNRDGTIRLMGDMQMGTTNVDGRLDASAPNGGNGGFIETSAAYVNIQDSARITTAAAQGLTGTWLIDPLDFIIQAGFNISGAALSAQLVDNNVVITTLPGDGNGDIFVNEAITWNGALGTSLTPTTLTLNAFRNVNIGRNSAGVVIPTAAITATNGNLVVCCGADINVFAAITATDGSVLLNAGNDVNVNAAITTTRGNLSICAGHDVVLNGLPAAIVMTDPAAAPERSLGLPSGLVLRAGGSGTGPGVAGGTVRFEPFTPPAAITRVPVQIFYNPTSYATPTDYSTATFFTLVGPGATVTSFMLVYPDGGTKVFDGTTVATLEGLKSTALSGIPANVTLIAGPGSTANFDTADVGLNKTITFTGYTLGGTAAASFALPVSCCEPVGGRTLANITPAPIIVVPPIVEVPVPPIVVVPPVTPPPIVVVPPVTPVDMVVAEVELAPDAAQFLLEPETLPVQERINLTVQGTGVRMPVTQAAYVPPPPPVQPAPVQPAPVVVPPKPLPVQPPPVVVPPPPVIYVAPPLPPKQDRN